MRIAVASLIVDFIVGLFPVHYIGGRGLHDVRMTVFNCMN